jgi:hypothetical protein
VANEVQILWGRGKGRKEREEIEVKKGPALE